MGKAMTNRERLLLETLAGHFAWLKSAYPRKAASPLVRRAQRSVQSSLRSIKPQRKAA
jgi:hypothetical protein